MENSSTFQKSFYKVKVEKGKTYSWCACGLSQKQPFCDGAHTKEEKLRPLQFLAAQTKEIYLCGCKMTKQSPYCDGSHSKP